MIDLDPNDLEIVKAILAQVIPQMEVHVFGSRVNGTSRKFSDLDILLLNGAPVGKEILVELMDRFSASDLPIKVDVVDWHTLDPSFQSIIQKSSEVLQKKGGPILPTESSECGHRNP